MIRETVCAALCALFATGAQAALATVLPPHNWITPARALSETTSGRVAYYTGNDLYELCQKDEFTCTVYIQGVIDGQMSAVVGTSRTVAYCIPHTGSTPKQVKDVVLAFLTANPGNRHRMAGGLVASALANTWARCP